MAGHLVAGLGCRAEDDDLHAEAFGFEGDIDIDGVDAGVREDPDAVALVEVPAAHDGLAVAFGAFEEEELVDAHFTDDVGEEGEGDFAEGVEADEAADAGIHFLDRKICVAAAEGVYPAAGLDGIGHYFGDLTDILHLCRLDLVHHGESVALPLFSVILCNHLLYNYLGIIQ